MGGVNTMLLAVLSALLGSHAVQIGGLLVYLWDQLLCQDTNAKYQTEAGIILLALGFATLRIISGNRALKLSDPVKADEEQRSASIAIIVGFVGGFLSVIDKTSKNGVPTPETAEKLFYVAVVGFIFALPVLVSRWDREGLQATTRLTFALGIAAVTAFLGGLVIQCLMKLLGIICTENCGFAPPTEPFRIGSTSFFLSAPTVAGILAPWALLIAYPWTPASTRLNTPRRKVAWSAGYVILALALSAYYAIFVYAAQHLQDGWLASTGFSNWRLIFMFWALHVPALTVATFAAFRTGCRQRVPWLERADTGYAAAAFAPAALFAGILAMGLFHQNVGLTFAKAIVFAACHGLTAAIAVLAVRLAVRRSIRAANLPSEDQIRARTS